MLADNAETTRICDLTSTHGLDLSPETITVNELGLEFQVAIAAARWPAFMVITHCEVYPAHQLMAGEGAAASQRMMEVQV